MAVTKEKQIERFIEQHGLGGQPYEVPNSSELSPRPGRCYQLRLTRKGTTAFEVFQIPAGKSIEEMTLADALWTLTEDADRYGGHETFEKWNHENDEGSYVRQLGRKTAELLYERERDAYNGLVKVLGGSLPTVSRSHY